MFNVGAHKASILLVYWLLPIVHSPFSQFLSCGIQIRIPGYESCIFHVIYSPYYKMYNKPQLETKRSIHCENNRC